MTNPYESPASNVFTSKRAGSQIIAEFRPEAGFTIFWCSVGILFFIGFYPITNVVVQSTPINHAGAWIGAGGISIVMLVTAAMSLVNALTRIRVFEDGIGIHYGKSDFYLWSSISEVGFQNTFLITLEDGKKRQSEVYLGEEAREKLLELSNILMEQNESK